MNGSPTPILDRIEKRRRETLTVLPRQSANVVSFQRRTRPVWLERLTAKDMSEWRPDDAA